MFHFLSEALITAGERQLQVNPNSPGGWVWRRFHRKRQLPGRE
jgi:hypothetical protein